MSWWKSLLKILGKGFGATFKRSLGLLTFAWSKKKWLTVLSVGVIFFTPIIREFISNGVAAGLFLSGKSIFLPDLQIQEAINKILLSGDVSWWEAVRLRGALLAPITTLGIIIFLFVKLFDFFSRDSALKSILIAVLILAVGETIFIAVTQDVTSITQVLPFRGLFYDLPKNILVILSPFIPFFNFVSSAENVLNVTANSTNSTAMDVMINATNSTG